MGSSSSACVITRACATLRSPRPSAVSDQAPAPVQCLGQRQVTPVRAVVAERVLSEQRRDVAGTLGQRDVVGGRHHPQPQRRQLGLEPSQPQQRRPLVTGIHEHDLHIGALLQRRLDGIGTREHRVRAARRRSNSPRTSCIDDGPWVLTCRCSVPVSSGPDGPGRSLSITIGSNLCSIIPDDQDSRQERSSTFSVEIAPPAYPVSARLGRPSRTHAHAGSPSPATSSPFAS